MFFFDLDGTPVEKHNMDMLASSVKTFQQGIECRANYKLFATPLADTVIEAKHNASPTWIDIESGHIALDPWDATIQTFDFRITTNTVLSTREVVLNVRP